MSGISDEAIETWARLVRVAGALLAAVESDLKAAGLPPLAWYDALLELRRAGGAGLRPFELQREMLLAQYNVSRLVDRLASAGLIERRPCPDDLRGQVLYLTPAGRRLLKHMWPIYREAIERNFAAHLSGADIKRLHALLGRLLQPADGA